MLSVLATGTLFGAPAKKTSARGNSFVSAKLKVPTANGEVLFVGIVAFRESIGTQLLELTDGSALSVAGDLKAGAYTAKDGTIRASLDITVSEILTASHVDKRRNAMRDARSGQERAPTSMTTTAAATTNAGDEDFDDEIPF